jgi:hypothetical protein
MHKMKENLGCINLTFSISLKFFSTNDRSFDEGPLDDDGATLDECCLGMYLLEVPEGRKPVITESDRVALRRRGSI